MFWRYRPSLVCEYEYSQATSFGRSLEADGHPQPETSRLHLRLRERATPRAAHTPSEQRENNCVRSAGNSVLHYGSGLRGPGFN